jgi:hypothetical protein
LRSPLGAPLSATCRTIPRAGSIAAARTVEEIAAIAAAAPLGEKDRRYRWNRLGGAEQLDPSRRRRLLFRRQNGQNRDPIDLDLSFHAQHISNLGVVGEDLGIDDALRLPCPSGAPGVAAVTPQAGEFDVETVRHAPVKLQAGAGFAKWRSLRGARTVTRHALPADALQPQAWNATLMKGIPQMTSGPLGPLFHYLNRILPRSLYSLLLLGL